MHRVLVADAIVARVAAADHRTKVPPTKLAAICVASIAVDHPFVDPSKIANDKPIRVVDAAAIEEPRLDDGLSVR